MGHSACYAISMDLERPAARTHLLPSPFGHLWGAGHACKTAENVALERCLHMCWRISLEACMRTYPTYVQARSLMSCWAKRPRTHYSGKELAVRMQLATFQSQVCFCSMSSAVNCEICKIRHLHSWQLRTVGSSWPRLQQFCMHLCCSVQGL